MNPFVKKFNQGTRNFLKGEIRRVNIRPFIRDIRVSGDSATMSLVVSEKGTTRVEEVWKALGLRPETLLSDCTITRTGMQLSASI